MEELLQETVVLDAHGTYVYVGRLTRIESDFLVLEDCDAHDLRDSPTTTREQYVLRCREHGVVVNRRRVYVARQEVVAVSCLADVIVC